MAASYPTAAKSFTTKTDGPTQTIIAAHVNALQDEIVAIENGLLTGVAHDTTFNEDVTIVGDLSVTGDGPHSLGGSPSAAALVNVGGSFTPASGTECRGLNVNMTLHPAVNGNGAGLLVEPTLVEAASGNHSMLAALWVQPPTVTAGAGTTDGAAALYVHAAPSGATLNYAVRVASGLSSFAGQVNLDAGVAIQAWELHTSVISPTTLAADANNYSPTGLANSRILRLSSDASRTITGLLAGSAGQRLTFQNIGGNDIVLKHGSGSSTAANQFQCPGNVDFTLNSGDGVELWYDGVSSRWRVVAA